MIIISSKNYCYCHYHYYYYFYWYLLEALICRNTFHDIIKETLECKHWHTLFMLHSIFARTLRLIIDGIRAIRGHTSNKIANTSNRVIAVGFVYSLKNKTTILVMKNAKRRLWQVLRHNSLLWRFLLSRTVFKITSTHTLRFWFLRSKRLNFLLCRQNKLDCILVFTDFISCLPPETPRNIALIYSISP